MEVVRHELSGDRPPSTDNSKRLSDLEAEIDRLVKSRKRLKKREADAVKTHREEEERKKREEGEAGYEEADRFL